MLFAQFAGLNSLREIEQGLAAHPGGLYHLDLRLPRRSTLSDAQAHRPVAVFRDICQMLIGQVSRVVRQQGQDLIQLVDGSPILLRDPRLGWAEADPHTHGLKVHIGYDPRSDVVDWVEIASPGVSELTVTRAMPLTARPAHLRHHDASQHLHAQTAREARWMLSRRPAQPNASSMTTR